MSKEYYNKAIITKGVSVEYYITAKKSGEREIFGLYLAKTEGGEIIEECFADGVTENREKALDIADKIYRGAVTPFVLGEILDELII